MGDDKKLGSDQEMDGLILPDGDELRIGSISDDSEEESFGLKTNDRQAAEIRQIFGTTFPQYLMPVEEIVEQILNGEVDEESVSALNGMLDSLLDASSRMGFDEVHSLISELAEAIASLAPTAEQLVEGEQRENILGVIIDLKDLTQEMGGDVGPLEKQRSLISALKNKPGIGQLVLKRLSAAGLVTVDQVLMAGPEEVAVFSGLDVKIDHEVIRVLNDEPDETKDAEQVPAEIESLHEEVIRQLSREVESQTSVDELKLDIRKLRNVVIKYRAEIELLEENVDKKKVSLRKLNEQLKRESDRLSELQVERDLLVRRYELSRDEQ